MNAQSKLRSGSLQESRKDPERIRVKRWLGVATDQYRNQLAIYCHRLLTGILYGFLLVFGDPEGFFGILFTFRRHFKAVELIQSRFKSAVIVDAALAGKY